MSELLWKAGVLLRIIRWRLFSHRPIVLSHFITKACNAKCAICNFWKLPKEPELSTQEIFRILEEAQELGFVSYVCWGGEPLLRQDLPAILDFSKELGFHNTVITNGSLLSHFATKLTSMDLCIVSVDFPDKRHDELRGINNLLCKVLNGINQMKRHSKILLNCVVSKLNLQDLGAMVNFAKQLGVNIAFEPIVKIPKYNEALCLTLREQKEAFEYLVELKKTDQVINNSLYYLQLLARNELPRYTCHSPKVTLFLGPDGQIQRCGMPNHDFGSAQNETLARILNSYTYAAHVQAAENCSKCTLSFAVEPSLLYSLDRSVVLNFLVNTVTAY
ncbi:MAG: radical SAM protein [Candidatus Heimdallarchaeota archaeon]